MARPRTGQESKAKDSSEGPIPERGSAFRQASLESIEKSTSGKNQFHLHAC